MKEVYKNMIWSERCLLARLLLESEVQGQRSNVWNSTFNIFDQ